MSGDKQSYSLSSLAAHHVEAPGDDLIVSGASVVLGLSSRRVPDACGHAVG